MDHIGFDTEKISMMFKSPFQEKRNNGEGKKQNKVLWLSQEDSFKPCIMLHCDSQIVTTMLLSKTEITNSVLLCKVNKILDGENLILPSQF